MPNTKPTLPQLRQQRRTMLLAFIGTPILVIATAVVKVYFGDTPLARVIFPTVLVIVLDILAAVAVLGKLDRQICEAGGQGTGKDK